MIGFVVALILSGLMVAVVARTPGFPMVRGTLLLSVVGSCVGGFLGYLPFGGDLHEGVVWASGIVGSINGAVIGLLIYQAIARRSTRFPVWHRAINGVLFATRPGSRSSSTEASVMTMPRRG